MIRVKRTTHFGALTRVSTASLTLTCLSGDEATQYFACIRRVFPVHRGNQFIGFLGREIAVVPVGMNPDGKSRAIPLGKKLRRVDIFTHAKHLHRAGIASEQ